MFNLVTILSQTLPSDLKSEMELLGFYTLEGHVRWICACSEYQLRQEYNNRVKQYVFYLHQVINRDMGNICRGGDTVRIL